MAARDPNARGLLIAVFASPDRLLGVQVADAIRGRVTSAVSARQVWVIPKSDITNYLESSGYKADSSLGPADLKELAKLLRADEVLFGTVTRTPTGIKVEPRLVRATDVTQGQPLPVVEASNPSDAARSVSGSLVDSRKQLADVQACENAIRDKQIDKAIAAANLGISKYPAATLARLCLALAYREKNLPDSVLKVVEDIRRIDPMNAYAWRQAYWAYDAKGDAENTVRALVQLLKLEPGNSQLQDDVVLALARLGRPAVALPIVDTLLMQSPGDPKLLRQKWLLSLAAGAAADSANRPALFAAAVAAGEEMMRADTTLADSTFFARQILAANQLTPPRGAEFAARAVQKFPNNAEFWWLKANAERKGGQSQLAMQSLSRLLTIDPKYPNAGLLLATLYLETNQSDSAVAMVRRAVAAGEDPKTWGQFLLQPTNAAFRKAQESKSIPDWRQVLALAQEADKLSPAATSKFFIGVSSYYIASDLLTQAQPILAQATKTENARQKNAAFARACPMTKEAQELILLIQTNMPAGGSVDANTAQAILGWVGQASPAADQMAKTACK